MQNNILKWNNKWATHLLPLFLISLSVIIHMWAVLEPKYHGPQPLLNETAPLTVHSCHTSTGHLNFPHNDLHLFATRFIKPNTLSKHTMKTGSTDTTDNNYPKTVKISSLASANSSSSISFLPPRLNSFHSSRRACIHSSTLFGGKSYSLKCWANAVTSP